MGEKMEKKVKNKNDGAFNLRFEVFDIIDKIKDFLDKEEFDLLKEYLVEKEKYLKVMVWDDPAENYVNNLLDDLVPKSK